MNRTISITIGEGSIGHNNREFFAPNVDRSRTSQNITLISDDIKEVYHELFDEALEKYNAKQKRKDRVIKDYYEHIYHSKQEKPFYEIIVQVGNKEDAPCNSQAGETAKQILLQFARDMQKCNPHIRIFNSVLHLDEATPHLHIDFIPFATEQKRGLSTRNSLTKALEQQGFIAKGQLDTSSKLWVDSEKQQLAEIMKQYGIEWEQLGTHHPHLSVLDYKKQERAKEIMRLENKIECTDKLIQRREKLLSEVETVIDKLDGEYQEKQSATQKADEELSEKNSALAETVAALENNRMLLEATADKVSQIKAIDDIETGKTVFGKVTLSQEDYVNLADLAKKQIAAESRENELSTEIEQLKQSNATLVQEKSDLAVENDSLKKEVKFAKSLRESLNKALREVDDWKRKYRRVMEFVESLELTKRLHEFLKPSNINRHR